MRIRALCLGLAITAAACGRSSLRLPSAGSTTGAGGGTSTSSATTTATTDVSASSSAGTGGAMCGVETHDTVEVAFHAYNGPLVGCFTGAKKPPLGDSTQSVIGEVVSASAGSLTIDSCSPSSDCAGKLSKLTFIAPGFVPYVPIGAFVEVRFREVIASFACADTVMVRNLPSWDGAPNPVSTSDLVWLAASSSDEAFADAPYQIESVPLGCYPEDPGGACGEMDDYVFRVTIGGSPFDVGMGVTSEVGNPPQWVFRNLQSYTTGFCGDPPHFAYWMSIPMLD